MLLIVSSSNNRNKCFHLLQDRWADGIPVTVRSFSVYNEQHPARRHREKDSLYNRKFDPDHRDQLFALDFTYPQGSCFLWSSNLLTSDTWVPVNCTSQIVDPFIICEKKITVNTPVQIYKRSAFNCNPLVLLFNVYCIRFLRNYHYSQLRQSISTDAGNVFSRILSAWTMPFHTDKNKHKLAVLKWFEHDQCVCLTSYDTFYIENKTWHNDVCSCKTNYPAVLMMLPTATVTVELLFTCADGNSTPAVYRCDDGIDCENGDDEDNCFQVCSTHANCTTGCLSPACVCMPLYHQCLRGGCVQWSFVCDGVIN